MTKYEFMLTKTARGFELIKFVDHYGVVCSLQQSSLAIFEQPGFGAIWLGIDDLDKRMHLNFKAVSFLHERLGRWLNTGSFYDKDEFKE